MAHLYVAQNDCMYHRQIPTVKVNTHTYMRILLSPISPILPILPILPISPISPISPITYLTHFTNFNYFSEIWTRIVVRIEV